VAGEIRIGGTHLLDLAPGSTQSFWGTSGIGDHGRSAVFEHYRGSRIVGEDDPNLPI
jgi:betaine-aldehyde dehydrogenase